MSKPIDYFDGFCHQPLRAGDLFFEDAGVDLGRSPAPPEPRVSDAADAFYRCRDFPNSYSVAVAEIETELALGARHFAWQ